MAYIVISIHLCATFLYELETAIIALVQLAAIIILIAFNQNIASIQWPNFIVFIVCATCISILTSFIHHRHIEVIEAQNKALRANEEQLIYLSTRDSLTGLYNRRYMKDTLDREIAQAIRRNQPLALMMVDINSFKDINDTHGHIAGDLVLTRIAQILLKSVRQSDVVSRFGGDEFIIILPGCSMHMAESRKNDIMDALSLETIEYAGKSISPITMSFGFSSLRENGITKEQLLQAVDASLYEAKKHKLLKNK